MNNLIKRSVLALCLATGITAISQSSLLAMELQQFDEQQFNEKIRLLSTRIKNLNQIDELIELVGTHSDKITNVDKIIKKIARLKVNYSKGGSLFYIYHPEDPYTPKDLEKKLSELVLCITINCPDRISNLNEAFEFAVWQNNFTLFEMFITNSKLSQAISDPNPALEAAICKGSIEMTQKIIRKFHGTISSTNDLFLKAVQATHRRPFPETYRIARIIAYHPNITDKLTNVDEALVSAAKSGSFSLIRLIVKVNYKAKKKRNLSLVTNPNKARDEARRCQHDNAGLYIEACFKLNKIFLSDSGDDEDGYSSESEGYEGYDSSEYSYSSESEGYESYDSSEEGYSSDKS